MGAANPPLGKNVGFDMASIKPSNKHIVRMDTISPARRRCCSIAMNLFHSFSMSVLFSFRRDDSSSSLLFVDKEMQSLEVSSKWFVLKLRKQGEGNEDSFVEAILWDFSCVSGGEYDGTKHDVDFASMNMINKAVRNVR
mmetsp:Transcript_47998/g.71131  ORF Transcript_47998/g.71131 Transcript_47998/m.71131 type:complete len:139 (+) Transcript_47998:257-673(+)